MAQGLALGAGTWTGPRELCGHGGLGCKSERGAAWELHSRDHGAPPRVALALSLNETWRAGERETNRGAANGRQALVPRTWRGRAEKSNT